MSQLVLDLKFAIRTLAKKPFFSALVVGILALGIAGNAAIFSIFNGLFLRPLPSPEAHRLLDLNETAPQWNLRYTGIAYPDFHAWREQNQTFESMAVWSGGSVNLSGRGEAQRIRGARVTHDLAKVVGIQPVIGRNFTPEEDKPGATKVVILGHKMWQNTFGADPRILGSVLQLNAEAHTVIGVLPREADFPANADLWVPLSENPQNQSGWYLSGIGRLKPGVSIEQAKADLDRIHKAMIPTRNVNRITSPIIAPVRDRYVGNMWVIATSLLAAVAVILVMACVNIAGLMLAHGTSRTREMAIRTAMGATRARVVRQLLTESLVLAIVGGIAGVLLGWAGQRALISTAPDNLPRWVTFDLDWRFLGFTLLVTGLAAVLSGLAPALRSARVDVRGSLQDSSARASLGRGGRRSLSALVVAEIALALVLLATSGLLLQAFRKVMNVNPGFRTEGVLTFAVSLPGPKYTTNPQRIQFYEQLIEKIRALPGVAAVGAVTNTPLGGHSGNFYEAEGAAPLAQGEQDPVVLRCVATPGYFEAIGMTLAAGRMFEARDGEEKTPPVTIVNETFAKRYWPGGEAVGKRIRSRGSNAPWIQVVGVMRDVKHYGLEENMRPNVFFPHRQQPGGGMTVVVRTAQDPHMLIPGAREVLRRMDADLPMFQVETMGEKLDRSLWTRRASSWLFVIFAGVALILAVAGTYGVLAYAVSQRSREIAIRMALGAEPRRVLGQVLRQGMTLVIAGIVVGIAAAVGAASLLKTQLFGVSARDPLTYALVVVGLCAVALVANLIPARRAANVDPMTALRFE